MSFPRPLSVIVPVRDNAGTLARALVAILASELPRDDYELIVVDDASSDGSSELAARYADTVVRLTGRRSGAAYARNRGAELAQGDVLVFVDADALVRPDTLPRMLRTLTDRPGLDAVSASHDQIAMATNLVSQYWYLLLNYGEQREEGTSGDMASPCVAIRRQVFLAAGMYDEWRFEPASLEGIELGRRLVDSGHGVLSSRDFGIAGLKRWSLRSLCREVWHRSALLARSLGYQRTRTVAPREVVFTLTRNLTPVLAASCVVAFSAAFVRGTNLATEAAIVVAGAIALNFRAFQFFVRSRGIGFAIAAAPLHLLMQVTSGLGLVGGWVLRDAIGDLAPDAATQAYSEVGAETWPPVRRAIGG
jgi:glycosyltransferase involved in cell wall biosynthesis